MLAAQNSMLLMNAAKMNADIIYKELAAALLVQISELFLSSYIILSILVVYFIKFGSIKPEYHVKKKKIILINTFLTIIYNVYINWYL